MIERRRLIGKDNFMRRMPDLRVRANSSVVASEALPDEPRGLSEAILKVISSDPTRTWTADEIADLHHKPAVQMAITLEERRAQRLRYAVIPETLFGLYKDGQIIIDPKEQTPNE